MRLKSGYTKLCRAALALAIAASFAGTASAASLTWDITPGIVGVGDNAITGGLGTWDTSNGNWTVDGGANNIAWDNLNIDTAIFGGTAGTVTLGTPITAGGLTFNSSGYTVTGNTLTLGTPTVTVTNLADTATISSIIDGSAGLTKSGNGILVLGADNIYTGGTTVSAGTLRFTNSNQLEGATSIDAGATLLYAPVPGSAGGNINIANTITGAGTLRVDFARLIATSAQRFDGIAGFAGTIQLALVPGAINTNDKYQVGGAGSGVASPNADLVIGNGTQLFSSAAGTFKSISVIGTGNTEGRGAIRLINTITATNGTTLAGNTTLGFEGGTLAGAVNLGANTLTIGTINSNSAGTISGIIGGSGGINNVSLGGVNLTGNNNFTGPVTISSGVLKVGNANALGATSGTTTVLSGGTLDINGIAVNTGEQISVAGSGFNGVGAVINTGASQTNALNRLILTANASVGGTQRFDIRTGTTPTLNLAGFTLTKTGANQFSLVGTSVTNGNININAGILSIETTSVVTGTGTVTVNPGGSLGIWQTTATNVTRPIVSNGGTIYNLGNNGALNSPITLNTGTTTTFGGPNAFTNTFGGAISGAGNLTKAGAETVVLAGTNNYTGITRLNAGTLTLDYATNNTSKLPDAGTLYLGGISGATLQLAGATGNHVETVGSVIVNGSATISRNGANTASIALGAYTNNGVLNVAATGLATTTNPNNGAGYLPGTLFNGTQFAANDGSNNIIASSVTYSDVTRLNGGTQVIPAAAITRIIDGTGTAANITVGAGTTDIDTLLQTATGGTTTVDLTGGVLRVGATGEILSAPAASALTIQNGTLTAGGADDTAGTLWIRGGNNATTVSSLIANNGTGAVALNTSGNVTLGNASNSFSGGTSILGGTTNIAAPGALGTASSVTINGGRLNLTTNAMAFNKAVSIGANDGEITTPNAAQTTTMSVALSGAGRLTFSGTGDFDRSAAGAASAGYSTGVIINGPRVRVANQTTALGSGPITILGGPTAGGQLYATGGTWANSFFLAGNGGNSSDTTPRGSLRLDNATVSGPVTLISDAAIGVNSGTGTVSGLISGAFALTKVDGSTLVLSNTGNSYSGGTIVNTGELRANAGTSAAGTKTTFGTGLITVNSGATLRFFAGSTANQYTYANPINLNSATLAWQDGNHILSGNITLTGANTLAGYWAGKNATISGVISGAGAFNLSTGPGTGSTADVRLTLNGNNTYSGGTTISSGTIVAGTSTALGSGVINANHSYGLTYATAGRPFLQTSVTGLNIANDIVLSGTTGYYGLQMGAAAGGTVTYSGNISGGGAGTVLQIDTPNGGDATSLASITGNNTLLTGQVRLNRGAVSLGNANAIGTASLYLDVNSNVTNGNVRFAGAMTLSNPIIVGATPGQGISTATGDITLTGSLTNNAANITGGITKVGANTLTLTNAANDLTGPTTIGAGTLSIAGAGRISATAYAANLVNNGTLNYASSTDQEISGGVSGSGSLTKSGTSVLTLSGSNTYGGTTTVNGGTLAVNNTAGSGTGTAQVVVNTNGTLAGNGFITGAVNITGGTLSPGNSIDSLDTGALSFTGGTFAAEINTTTPAADLVNVAGNLNISGSPTLTLTDLGSNSLLTAGTVFKLIDYSGSWNMETFSGYADDSTFTFGANSYLIDYNDPAFDNSALTLTVQAIPEPSTLVLGGLALLGLAGMNLRRRRLPKQG